MLRNPRWNGSRDVVEFEAFVHAEWRPCWISMEALGDQFGAKSPDFVAATEQNAAAIVKKAEKLAHHFAANEPIQLRTEFF